jgi:regulator of protease activity HflC (stomatin/prohibitin superfamily)
MNKLQIKAVVIAVIALVAFSIGSRFWKSVPAGHVAVATLFGEVQPNHFREGLNIPVNPLYDWHLYDVRQQTHMERANVPSQDQLKTQVEMSLQYRLIAEQAPSILKETGSALQVLKVHVVPKVRSLVREQGKSIKRAEDFFLEETQQNLQTSLLEGLREYLGPKGIFVDAVLIREISLPAFITKAIEEKKEREQEVEKQKAELERFRTEQQQLVAEAQAKRLAADEEAQTRRTLADAQAYEIERINTAIGKNPNYVKLMALDALKEISKDPASKIYFINGDSPMPLPLMHMGDQR